MMIKELEMMYENVLHPVFESGFHIIHDRDDFMTGILDGDKEDFFFTLYGTNHVRLYWCNECFIFDERRNELVSSDTYGEIVFEGNIDVQTLPGIIVELVLRLKDCVCLRKEETVTGKIPSGYDDRKDYRIIAATQDPAARPYQLENILIEFVRP